MRPFLVCRSGNSTPLLLASQAWQSSPPNLLRSSGSRPLTAFAFGFRRVLAHQTFCEIWAQGPVSLLRQRACPSDSATHEWHALLGQTGDEDERQGLAQCHLLLNCFECRTPNKECRMTKWRSYSLGFRHSLFEIRY